jgi:CysZ protein
MARTDNRRRPSTTFTAGLLSVFRAFGQLGRLPKAWPYALVPTFVFVALATLGVWGAFAWLEPIMRGALPQATSWYGRYGANVVSWVGAAFGALAAVLLAMVLAAPISAPALERIVALVEIEIGAPPRPRIGWFGEIACGLRALAAGAMFGIPAGALLWLVDLLFPPATLVTVPLRALVAALVVAWNLIDYPLTLRGIRVRERLALVRTEWRSFVGFGLGFLAAFWVPCCGIVFLPVGVIGATRLTSRWLSASSPRALRLAGEDGPTSTRDQ